jgi:hypothetical protein
MVDEENGGQKMIIKKDRMFILTLCLAASFAISLSVRNADSKIVTNVPADVTGEETRALVIEDFENSKIVEKVEEDGWFVSSNPKEYQKGDDETKKKKNPIMALKLKLVDGGPNDMKVEEEYSPTKLGKEKKKNLGLHFRFRYPGNNSVSLEPPMELDWKERSPVKTYDQASRKDIQERGLQLPGRVKAISMWVHARGFPYTIELWVKDFRGDVHILEKKSINFVGWRPLTFEIPRDMPQSSDTYPVTRVSKLVKIVIREVTNVTGEYSGTSVRNSQDVYVFFDQIKVLTDTYEVFFDGQDLHKSFEGTSESKSNTSTK